MSTETILWHDYETTGRDSRADRPLQFAAVRTTLDLEEVGEPIALRCELPIEVLPEPEACLVTGVVPGDFASEEVSELEFAREIQEAFRQPKTCVAGYNSIRFDDEFSRFLFWRNLLPIYDREWRNGNSRWDLLDPLRAAYALRPEGIEWPMREDGTPSFKLELLTAANGIDHGEAHDAVADVRATISMARLLRERIASGKLYGYLFDSRRKQANRDRIPLGTTEPIVHVSGKIAAKFACATLVMPLCVHEEQKNQILCADLRRDPQVLLDESAETLRERLFAPRDRSGQNDTSALERPGIKGVHLNKAPVLAPWSVLDADETAWDRMQLDRATVEARAQLVVRHRAALAEKVQAVHQGRAAGESPDVAAALYDGFVGDSDQRRAQAFHSRGAAHWPGLENEFEDARLRELAFRLRAREAPESLTEAERVRFDEFVRESLRAVLPDRLARCEALAADPERKIMEIELLGRLRALLLERGQALDLSPET
ncbi:MAG: exodeoxyribonuclease I [Planctomycetota bacterium]